MFITQNTSPRPMFPVRSRLAIARDIAVLAVCAGIVLGFLIEVWSPSTPRRATTPASVDATYVVGA